MKKSIFALIIVLGLSVAPQFAEIGENFEKGGFGLSGSISLFDNFFYLLDPSSTDSFVSVDIEPTLDYYVADRLALRFSPWYYYEADKYDQYNIYRSMSYGMRIGFDYVLAMDPDAVRGSVITAGCVGGISIYPTVDDLIDDVETPNNFMNVYLSMTLTPRVYFFVNDRVAPFIGISPQLIYTVAKRDTAGDPVDLELKQRVRGNVTATFGFSFFVPNSKASILSN